MKMAYIAAPIFSPAEQDFNMKIDSVCQTHGFKTFLVQRDEGIVKEQSLLETFKRDLKNLKMADIIVANLDGIDVDSGTSWEIGYAYANNIPVIGIRNDVRMYRSFLPVNLMIYQSCKEFTTLDNLSETLKKYL